MSYFLDEFPTTPEEFDRAGVITTTMVRIDLVKWINTMVKKYQYPDHYPSVAETLKFYSETITYSFDRMNWIYKLQAAENLKQGILINVQPGNYYYDILFKANRSWHALTFEIVKIFISTKVIDNHPFVYELVKLPPCVIGRQIMDLIVENKSLYHDLKTVLNFT